MEFDDSLYIREQSFALNQLDLKLRDYLSFTGGFFIEAGANDGISQSNTMLFEKYRKWKGILIEPIPFLAESCKTNRPNCIVENCALVPFDYQDSEIEMYYCNLMSMVKGAQRTKDEDLRHIERGCIVQNIQSYEMTVPVRTLTSILDQYNVQKIDLLSLDVEGFELGVLQGLDFERYQPDFLLIEARYRDEIDSFLSSRYEVVAELSHHDVLYKSRRKIEAEKSISISTPIAFFIFNRPDLTQAVFNTIAQVKPQKLLIISDGARSAMEAEKVQRSRSIVDQVDWDCDVLTNFSDKNLGCRGRISSGLDWVFSKVEEAIILEDDCLPSVSFFNFCQILLERYRDDERVFSISGDNFQFGRTRTEFSYYYSRYFHCWGWATWRRAWQYFDVEMPLWEAYKDTQLMNAVFEDVDERQYWIDILDKTHQKSIDSWAFIWSYTCWSQNGLTILPETNLVSNIGFRSDAVHTKDDSSSLANIPVSNIWEINHPTFVGRHPEADTFTFAHFFGGKQIEQPVMQTQANLQEVQSELEQARTQLSQFHIQEQFLVTELEQSQIQNQTLQLKLDRVKSELAQVRSRRKDLQSKFKKFRTQSRLRQQKMQRQLKESRKWITAMESSKFWKLRNKWMQFKKFLRLSSERDNV